MRSLMVVIVAAIAGFGLARWRTPAREAALYESTMAVAAESSPAPSATPDSSAAPAKPAFKRLMEAFDRSSPLRMATRALEVLDAMTAEDFRELAASPQDFRPPWVSGCDLEFSRAFMDALVTRWLAVDPAGAFPAMQKLEAELKKQQLAGKDEFAAALARVRPDLLLGALPEKASWERFDQIIPEAFTALAKRDPEAARSYLERIVDPEQRKMSEVAIAQGIAVNDPVAAVALARSPDDAGIFHSALAAAERIGAGTLRAVLVANDRKFEIGHTLTELVLRHPDEDWSGFVSGRPEAFFGVDTRAMREAQSYTPEQRQRVLARLDEFPPGARMHVSAALVVAWAREDAPAAVGWAFARAGTETEDPALSWAFGTWSASDLPGAIEWWSHLPASPLRERLGSGLATTFAVERKFDEAIRYFQPKPGPESAMMTANIAEAGAYGDPVRVAEWLSSLPPDCDTATAVVPVLDKWVALDAAAAAKWVEAQPAGPRRDAALHAYTRAAASRDPAAAAEWASGISDPAMRAKAAEYVFVEMDRTDATAARAWLRAQPGMDETWRERLIRLGR